jgi:NhaP-type Na+/H+ or K+/H+ antiporter
MAVSGLTGFIFFLLCNFLGLRGAVSIALAQLVINIFVHRSWWRGYKEEKRKWPKRAALVGAIVPVVMASITLRRVLLPAIGRWLGA